MTRTILAGAALVLATAAPTYGQSYYNPYTRTSVNSITAYNPYLRGYTGYTTGYNFNTGTVFGGTGYSGLYGSSFNRGYVNPIFGSTAYQAGVTTPFYTGYQSGYSNPFGGGFRAGYANPFGAAYQSGFVNPLGGGFRYNSILRPW
jgi:hypothetical protein